MEIFDITEKARVINTPNRSPHITPMMNPFLKPIFLFNSFFLFDIIPM